MNRRPFSWLPKPLDRIAELAGLDAALALAEARGGTRIYVPTRIDPDHWLVPLLGQSAAQAFADEIGVGGSSITLPLHPQKGLHALRRAADRALADGLSPDEAARMSGFTVRSIYRRKAKARQHNSCGQPGLFDQQD